MSMGQLPQPGQPPPPYQQQPPRNQPGIWDWYKRQTRTARGLLGCGLLFIILLLCSCVTGAFVSGKSPSTVTPTPTSSMVQITSPTATLQPTTSVKITSTPTRKSLVTPTLEPTATPIGPAVLGGNIGAFIAKFGTPNDHSDTVNGSYHFKRYANSNGDYLIVGTDIADGTRYNQLVFDIIAQSPRSQEWNAVNADAICSSFMPVDATYQKQVPLVDKDGTALGVDKVYYSASLAHKFPASMFEDTQQNPVQPGLFDVQYLYNKW